MSGYKLNTSDKDESNITREKVMKEDDVFWKRMKNMYFDQIPYTVNNEKNKRLTPKICKSIEWLRENVPALKNIISFETKNLGDDVEGREFLTNGGGAASVETSRLIFKYKDPDASDNGPTSVIFKYTSLGKLADEFNVGWITRNILYRPILNIVLNRLNYWKKYDFMNKSDFNSIFRKMWVSSFMFSYSEALFYSNKIGFKEHHQFTPKSYYSACYCEKRGMLQSDGKFNVFNNYYSNGLPDIVALVILEDVKGFTSAPGPTQAKAGIHYNVYEACAKTLARFHAVAWGKATEAAANMSCYTGSFTMYLFQGVAFPNGIGNFIRCDIDEIAKLCAEDDNMLPIMQNNEVKTVLKHLQKVFSSKNNAILRFQWKLRLGQIQPDTIIHGDPHLWNFLWKRKDNVSGNIEIDEVKMIDFQLLTVGLGGWDLAYMTEIDFKTFDSYEKRLQLLKVYHETLETELVKYGNEKNDGLTSKERYEKIEKDFTFSWIVFQLFFAPSLAFLGSYKKERKKTLKRAKMKKGNWIQYLQKENAEKIARFQNGDKKVFKDNNKYAEALYVSDGNLQITVTNGLKQFVEIWNMHPEYFGDE